MIDDGDIREHLAPATSKVTPPTKTSASLESHSNLSSGITANRQIVSAAIAVDKIAEKRQRHEARNREVAATRERTERQSIEQKKFSAQMKRPLTHK
jgi:hypothetical protein